MPFKVLINQGFKSFARGYQTTSKMPVYKLSYFGLKGRAEPIRFMLSYMGKKFEDVLIPREEWSSIKKTMPFGKIPTLEIDGKVYHQSAAICRYLSIEAGLSGKTPLENFEIDQIVGAIDDLVAEIGRIRRTEDPALQEKLKKTFIAEIVPFYFEKFEQIIQQNGGYLAIQRLSWADVYMAAISEALKEFLENPKLFESHLHLKNLIEKVHSQPGIKEWNKNRATTPL